jgi:ATP-dependent DNA helicase RecG
MREVMEKSDSLNINYSDIVKKYDCIDNPISLERYKNLLNSSWQVKKECKKEKIKYKFELLKSGYQVVFYRPTLTPPVKIDGLTDLENKILNLIYKDNKISTSAIAAKLNIKRDTVKEYIKKLKIKKKLKRVGKTSSGYWKVIKN